MENPIKGLFLSPGFPSSLLPVLAEPRSKSSLSEASRGRAGLFEAATTERASSPQGCATWGWPGHQDSKASPECVASRREAGMMEKPWGRAHSSSHRSWAFREETASPNPKSLKVPSRRAAQLTQLVSTGLPEEMLPMQHVLCL